MMKTLSIWTDVYQDMDKFKNIFYNPEETMILKINYSIYKIRFWEEYFLKYNFGEMKNNFSLSHDNSKKGKNKKKLVYFKEVIYWNLRSSKI